VFIVDIPERIDVAGPTGPLEGTAASMPQPPLGAEQRRLTFTATRKFPGVVLEPRHWLRSSPDGTRIVFLAKDEAGVVQAYFIAPQGGAITQITQGHNPVQSCGRWSPDGASIVYVSGQAVMVCDARPTSKTFGVAQALTQPTRQLPENVVWSHDGRTIAFNRRVLTAGLWRQQIFLVQP
jgi:Tol biopolymer transport system component